MSEYRVEATTLDGTPIDYPVAWSAATIDGEYNAGRICTILIPAIDRSAFDLVSLIGQHLISVWTPDNSIIFHGQTWAYGLDSDGVEEQVSIVACDPWANLARIFTNQLGEDEDEFTDTD